MPPCSSFGNILDGDGHGRDGVFLEGSGGKLATPKQGPLS